MQGSTIEVLKLRLRVSKKLSAERLNEQIYFSFLNPYLMLTFYFPVKYKEKAHEIDSLEIKLEQAAEFKIKIMESQGTLKKEIEQIKKEKQEAVQAHEDLSDIAEALEMATLDKEMAEEKVRNLNNFEKVSL